MGRPGVYAEYTRRAADGATIIRARLGEATARRNLERRLLPVEVVGLEGWERAHSIGAGLGAERGEGVLYAPRAVNQVLQKSRVESDIRSFVDQKAADVEVYLTTTTTAHPATRRLAQIEYLVEAVRDGVAHRVYEASIEVSNSRTNPRAAVAYQARLPFDEFLAASSVGSGKVSPKGRRSPPTAASELGTAAQLSSGRPNPAQRGFSAISRGLRSKPLSIGVQSIGALASQPAGQSRVEEHAKRFGYAPPGTEYGSSDLVGVARYLMDPFMGDDIGWDSRINIGVMRERLRQRAKNTPTGGRITFVWDVPVGFVTRGLNRVPELKQVRIVYQRVKSRFPGQGEWTDLAMESDDWPLKTGLTHVPDLDRLLDVRMSDAEIERYLHIFRIEPFNSRA